MKALIPAWRQNSNLSPWTADFDQVFNSLFDFQTNRNFDLSCDVEESDKHILFSIDLPGMNENDINVEVKDAMLTISGERKKETSSEDTNKEGQGKTYRGRQYGFFKHLFRIPKSVDPEKVEAEYANGVLKLMLTKFEDKPPKKIQIKSVQS